MILFSIRCTKETLDLIVHFFSLCHHFWFGYIYYCSMVHTLYSCMQLHGTDHRTLLHSTTPFTSVRWCCRHSSCVLLAISLTVSRFPCWIDMQENIGIAAITKKRGNIKKSVYALSSRKPSQQMPSSSSPSWENSTYSIKMAFYISFRLFCRFLNGPLVQYKNKVIWLTGWLGHVGKNFLERRRKKKRKEFANTLIYILKTFKRDLCLATYQTRLIVIC